MIADVAAHVDAPVSEVFAALRDPMNLVWAADRHIEVLARRGSPAAAGSAALIAVNLGPRRLWQAELRLAGELAHRSVMVLARGLDGRSAYCLVTVWPAPGDATRLRVQVRAAGISWWERKLLAAGGRRLTEGACALMVRQLTRLLVFGHARSVPTAAARN